MCTGVICVGVIEAVVVAEPEGFNMLPWVQLAMNERASSVGMESSHEIRVFEGSECNLPLPSVGEDHGILAD